MSMDKLIFLADRLQDPDHMKSLRLPAHFVEPAILKNAKMYKSHSHTNYEKVFVLRDLPEDSRGNKVVYGSIFLCNYWEVYRNVLDAYYRCSMATLNRNHIKDFHHREEINVTPIKFNTLDDLVRLNYLEKQDVAVTAYLANPDHPRVIKKLKHRGNSNQRMKSNIHLGFKKQYEGWKKNEED